MFPGIPSNLCCNSTSNAAKGHIWPHADSIPPFYINQEDVIREGARLEHDLDVAHLLPVPAGAHEGLVEEAENDQVLRNLLAQVMIDPVHEVHSLYNFLHYPIYDVKPKPNDKHIFFGESYGCRGK